MSKNIIICCDGTDNKFGDRNSNIVKIAQLSIYEDHNQLVYYDPGVGTLNLPNQGNFERVKSKLLGEGFGYGLEDNIEDAYKYLMSNFQANDKVFLFGFSRGAYTVRALAGLLNKFGLLRKDSYNLVPYVTEMYHQYNKINDIRNISSRFKASFSQECKPHFLGVFDTVEALGRYYKKKIFTDASLNSDIKFAFHAVSIDESRSPFKPFLWDENNKESSQIIEQVWFIGDHCDVGGSHLEEDLSDIPLKWILSKAETCGIQLKVDWQNTLIPNPLGKIHDLYDFWWSVSGIYPSLKLGREKRVIPIGANIHMSVKERMEKMGYQPNLPATYSFVD